MRNITEQLRKDFADMLEMRVEDTREEVSDAIEEGSPLLHDWENDRLKEILSIVDLFIKDIREYTPRELTKEEYKIMVKASIEGKGFCPACEKIGREVDCCDGMSEVDEEVTIQCGAGHIFTHPYSWMDDDDLMEGE